MKTHINLAQKKLSQEGEDVMVTKLTVTSSAFQNDGFIPSRYTCDGENISPPLKIQGVPEGAQSLVLICDDPDAPMGTWDHWIVWNIPPTTTEIRENTVPGTQGTNSARRQKYGGPCPPSGTHRYFFKNYALNTKLNLLSSAGRKDVEKAMEGHIVAQGELIGLYKRK